jgi:uncharacterized protein YuzE
MKWNNGCFTRLWNECYYTTNRGCGMPLYAIIIVFVLFILCSCATKQKSVESSKTKTETVKSVKESKSEKTDSSSTTHIIDVKDKERTNTKKSVEKSDSTVITVDSSGNVIKHEVWHNRKETISSNREYERLLKDSIASLRLVKDSLDYYMEICDSLLENDFHREYTVVEKQKIPKWCYYCLGICIIISIFAIVKIVLWLRKR